MKPALFEYRAPESVQETLAILEGTDQEAKVLAGGQSLVPAMNFRLARPEILLDINGLAELQEFGVDGHLIRIGALTKHVQLERWALPGPVGDLLRRAARWVGHLPIRVRGTFGGSLAHADPAAEWPVVVCALNSTIVSESINERREIGAVEFFKGGFSTALGQSDLLTEILIPVLPKETRVGFAEVSRRAGDFALVIAVAVLTFQGSIVTDFRLVLGGVSPIPVLIENMQESLVGKTLTLGLVHDFAEEVASLLDPLEDIHASSSYRRSLARAVITRSLIQAWNEE